MAEGNHKAVTTDVRAVTDLPIPVGVNFFHITRVESEFEVLMGNVSLLGVHDVATGGDQGALAPQITHRLLLSEFGFDKLVKAVTDMANKVKARQAERAK